MGHRLLAVVMVAVVAAVDLPSQAAEPSLEQVLQRVAAYASSYGEKASLIVAVEKYIQRFGTERPRQLVAEFAIVKAPGGWVGYRDVVEVNGDKVADRRDRLLSILTDPSADSRLVKRLSDESARYNIGPISRNFNVPTTVLLLFQPANLTRFTFRRDGTDRIGSVETWKVAFTEVKTPTFTMTRAGRDVPMDGMLWVVPADGTVVRTRMRLKNFADATAVSQQAGPEPVAPDVTDRPARGGAPRAFSFDIRTIETSADFAVTYRRYPDFEMWLPANMSELYEGPIQLGKGPPVTGRASTTATYSDFKQFQTGAKINIPQ
jgi:hypothetical protein